MNRRIFSGTIVSAMLLPVAAIPAFGAPPVAAADPLDIVKKIYATAAGKNGKYQGVSVIENKSVRKLYFSKSFSAAIGRAEALSKKNDEPIIDFDPVLNTQEDPEVKDLNIAVESEAPANSVVAATFTSYGEKNIVRYDFIKEGESWRIDDMRGESGNDKWSLRDIVK